MGLFSSMFKSSDGNTKSSGLPGSLVSKLGEVDKLYMEAFSVKSAKALTPYLTRECQLLVNRVVCSINARYFGDDKFRRTTWSLFSDDGDTMTVLKDVKFDSVKVAGKLSIAVAQDYQEFWIVEKNKPNLITSIKVRK